MKKAFQYFIVFILIIFILPTILTRKPKLATSVTIETETKENSINEIVR